MCTSEYLESRTRVTINSILLLGPFSLPTLKTGISQLYRKHIKISLFVWKDSSYSCLIKIAECSFKIPGLDAEQKQEI